MKNNLIITAGGLINQYRSKRLDNLIKKRVQGKKVLIVDNAILGTSNGKNQPQIKENFLNFGATICDSITLDKTNISKIFDYDVLYFTGGDTTPLIKLHAQTNIKEQIIKFLQSDRTIIGESAGSIFFGPDAKIYYDIKKGTKPKYDVVLPSYECLGLMNKFVYPHYELAPKSQRQKIKQIEKEHKIKITRLKDGKFLLFSI